MTRCSTAIGSAVEAELNTRAYVDGNVPISVTATAHSAIGVAIAAVNGNTPGAGGMTLSGGTQLISHDAGHECAAIGWSVASGAAPFTGSYSGGYGNFSNECAIAVAIPSSATSPVQTKTGTTVAGGIGTATMAFDAAPTAGNIVVLLISVGGASAPDGNLYPNDGLWTKLGDATATGSVTVAAYARCVQPGDGSLYGTSGGSFARTAAIMEWGPPAPTVDFTGTPLLGSAPLSVGFTGTADGFTPSSWAWDFGDGSSSGSGATPTHVYTVPGVYAVELTATDGTDTAVRSRSAYVTVRRPGIGLDVYGIDPPGDTITYLATLDGAFERWIRPERNAVGSGGFRIRRDDPDATDAVLAQGNLVKVTIPEIDPYPIFAFFIGSRETAVVSGDESGGEVIQVAGRGALDYFDWARWLAVSYVVPWWDAGWSGLVAGEPPAGSLGHVAVAAGTYRTFSFNADGTVVYPASTITTGGFSAFYDHRQTRRWEAGAPLAGSRLTLVKLSTGAYAGDWIHPSDAGITDVRASSVLGLRPEFGEIGKSDVTQWWDSGWGSPPGGTVGRVSAAAGTYDTYTVSGGEITAVSRGALTTGGFSAWLDRRSYLPFSTGKAHGTLIRLSSGAYSGTWLHITAPGLRLWWATEPDVSLLPGKVLWRVCQEVQAASRPSHPMPLLTYDFTEFVDSDGNDWVDTASLAGITAEVGDSYADTLSKILATGVVDFEMGADLDFHAWNERGRDLTGAAFGAGVVRFAKGVNIATDLQREVADGPVPTYSQVVGNDGWGSAELPDASSRVARETTTRVETDDAGALDAAGLADLTARLARSDAAGFAVLVGDDAGAGLYYPGPPGSAHGSYWLGDLVTVHTGTGPEDFDEETMRVAAITISETESGDLVAIPEVGSSLGAAEDAAFPGSGSGGSAFGSGSASATGSASVAADVDLSAYQQTAEKGIAGGYAPLDGSAQVPIASLPSGTPAIALDTAAAAGSATTILRTDATIAAFDATAPTDVAAAAATGSAAKAARRDHAHGGLGKPLGLTGATQATRYAGATTSGAPASGTFAVGDFVIDLTPSVWVCTVAGTPGTWAQIGGGGGGGGLATASSDHEHVMGCLFSGDGSTVAFELPAAPVDAYSVTAFVAGVQTAVTLSGALLTTATFGSAPAAGTDNVRFDITAAVLP